MTWIELIGWMIRIVMLLVLLSAATTLIIAVIAIVELVRGQKEPYDLWDCYVDDLEDDGWDDEDWTCPNCGRIIEGFDKGPEHHISYYHRKTAIGPEDSIRWKI